MPLVPSWILEKGFEYFTVEKLHLYFLFLFFAVLTVIVKVVLPYFLVVNPNDFFF